MEASTFADYKVTFPDTKAKSYANLSRGRVHKDKTGKQAPGNTTGTPAQEGGGLSRGRGVPHVDELSFNLREGSNL